MIPLIPLGKSVVLDAHDRFFDAAVAQYIMNIGFDPRIQKHADCFIGIIFVVPTDGDRSAVLLADAGFLFVHSNIPKS
jgi:hypothetical protein